MGHPPFQAHSLIYFKPQGYTSGAMAGGLGKAEPYHRVVDTTITNYRNKFVIKQHWLKTNSALYKWGGSEMETYMQRL